MDGVGHTVVGKVEGMGGREGVKTGNGVLNEREFVFLLKILKK